MSQTLTTPREQWAAAINDGCDPLTLLAYADWLEELGDETARAWRWFAETQSEPHYYVGLVWLWYSKGSGSWKSQRKRLERTQAWALLPMEGESRTEKPVWNCHATRFAAYEAAARALIAAYPNTEIPRP